MTNQEIKTVGQTIAAETQIGGNTAERVGGVIEGIGEALDNKDAAVGYYLATMSGSAIYINASSYRLGTGGNLRAKMPAAATTACTLTVGNANAVPLWYNGAAVSADNSWEAGEIVTIFYDGTRFMASNSQGGGGQFGSGEKIKDILLSQVLGAGTGTIISQKGVSDAIFNEIDISSIDSLKTLNDALAPSSSLKPTYYTVTATLSNVKLKVGSMAVISDNMRHVVTEIMATHYTLDDTGTLTNEHSDAEIFFIYRSVKLSGGTLPDAAGVWTKWRYVNASVWSTVAEKIKYDNSQSGLAADNVQEALDEVAERHTELDSEVKALDKEVLYGGLPSAATYSDAGNGWVLAEDGTIVDYAGTTAYRYTTPIAVEEGDLVKVTCWCGPTDLAIAAYTSDNTSVAIVNKSVVGVAGEVHAYEYVVPSGIAYIRITYMNNQVFHAPTITKASPSKIEKLEDESFDHIANVIFMKYGKNLTNLSNYPFIAGHKYYIRYLAAVGSTDFRLNQTASGRSNYISITSTLNGLYYELEYTPSANKNYQYVSVYKNANAANTHLAIVDESVNVSKIDKTRSEFDKENIRNGHSIAFQSASIIEYSGGNIVLTDYIPIPTGTKKVVYWGAVEDIAGIRMRLSKKALDQCSTSDSTAIEFEMAGGLITEQDIESYVLSGYKFIVFSVYRGAAGSTAELSTFGYYFTPDNINLAGRINSLEISSGTVENQLLGTNELDYSAIRYGKSINYSSPYAIISYAGCDIAVTGFISIPNDATKLVYTGAVDETAGGGIRMRFSVNATDNDSTTSALTMLGGKTVEVNLLPYKTNGYKYVVMTIYRCVAGTGPKIDNFRYNFLSDTGLKGNIESNKISLNQIDNTLLRMKNIAPSKAVIAWHVDYSGQNSEGISEFQNVLASYGFPKYSLAVLPSVLSDYWTFVQSQTDLGVEIVLHSDSQYNISDSSSLTTAQFDAAMLDWLGQMDSYGFRPLGMLSLNGNMKASLKNSGVIQKYLCWAQTSANTNLDAMPSEEYFMEKSHDRFDLKRITPELTTAQQTTEYEDAYISMAKDVIDYAINNKRFIIFYCHSYKMTSRSYTLTERVLKGILDYMYQRRFEFVYGNTIDCCGIFFNQ